MARNDEQGGRMTPPYIPVSTLTLFIDQLKSSALPPRIDTSVMHGKSGATQTGLRTAMRFLGLINADGSVTDDLRRLVAAYGTDGWKETFAAAISKGYLDHLSGLDLTTGTAAQLRETFRKNLGVEGQMLDKALRFYLGALNESDATYSPHFRRGSAGSRPRSAPRAGVRKRKMNGKAAIIDGPPEQREEIPPPSGMTRFPVPIPGKPGATISVPENITEDEWLMINTYVSTYIALEAKRAGKPAK